MTDLRIVQKRDAAKGRTFTAKLLAWMSADYLWATGDAKATRPIWMMLAGSDGELRPFVANLQTGNRAEVFTGSWSSRGSQKFEVLRSAGYHTSWQRTPHGSVATMYLPELFRLDPGMVDPTGIRFAILPEQVWLPTAPPLTSRRYPDLTDEELEYIPRIAPLFVAYLDRRTRCPIVADSDFHVRLLAECVRVKAARVVERQRDNRLGIATEGLGAVGLAPGLVFGAKHVDFEALLAEQTRAHFEQTRMVA